MRFSSIAGVAMAIFAATVSQGQILGPVDRAAEGAARAAGGELNRAQEAVSNERDRLNASADNIRPGAAANLSTPNARVNAQAGIQANDPNRWRYVQHNNQWWYYTPNNSWMYHNNNAWSNYDQATYVRPRYSTGYRGNNYNNNYNNNRRYNYAPRGGTRVRANAVVPGVAPRAGVGANVIPRGVANEPGINVDARANDALPGAITGEPVRDASEKARGVQPGDPGSRP